MQKLSKWILKLVGWTLAPMPEEPKKSVICVAPHTSNWDFQLANYHTGHWVVNPHF